MLDRHGYALIKMPHMLVNQFKNVQNLQQLVKIFLKMMSVAQNLTSDPLPYPRPAYPEGGAAYADELLPRAAGEGLLL